MSKSQVFSHRVMLDCYLPSVGLFFVGMVFPGAIVGAMLGLHNQLGMMVCCASGAALAVWYLHDLGRLKGERKLIINDDELIYQSYGDDVTRIHWDDVTEIRVVKILIPRKGGSFYIRRLQYQTAQQKWSPVLSGYPTPWPFCNGHFSFFDRAFLDNDEGHEFLISFARAKFKDRFFEAPEDLQERAKQSPAETRKSSAKNPRLLRQAAKSFQEQGNYEEAARQMLSALYMCPVLDSKNVDEYLDEYSQLLRKLGRDSDASQIESRSIEYLQTLTVVEHKIGSFLNKNRH